MLLGSLTKKMHESGISKKKVKPPYYGYSVDVLSKSVSGFSSPDLYSGYRRYDRVLAASRIEFGLF